MVKQHKRINRMVLLIPIETCQYCGGKVNFINTKKPGNKWPWIYLCSKCGARCGSHPNSNIPLGCLANNELTSLRNILHKEFDILWKTELMTRTQAYSKLASRMKLAPDECHIGQFTILQCRKALVIAKQIKSERDKEMDDTLKVCNQACKYFVVSKDGAACIMWRAKLRQSKGDYIRVKKCYEITI